MMEAYANAIVAELGSRLDGIAVFGGTANGGWDAAARDGKLPSPSVLVKESYDAPAKQTSYTVKTSDGSMSIRYCSPDVFAFMYGIEFCVFATERPEAEKTAQTVIDTCKGGVMIDVAVEELPDGTVPLFFKAEDREPAAEDAAQLDGFNQPGCLIRIKTTPEKSPKPFFYNPASNAFADMGGYVQYDLLVAARNCVTRYEFSTTVAHKTSFTPFMTGSTALTSKETKKNTKSYAAGGPVDRQWFNSKFKDVLVLCPDAYERVMRRDTMEEIQSHVDELKAQYDARLAEFCEALGVPEAHGTVSWWQPRTFRAFDLYIEEAGKDRFRTMDEILDVYKRRVAEEEKIQERKRAEREANGYASSGDDMFDSILSTAIGTAGLFRQQRKQTAELRKQTQIMEEEQKARRRREEDEWFRRFHNGEETGRYPR